MKHLRSIAFICGILACAILHAQQPLSIDDIFRRSDLNPKLIRGMEWIPGTQTLIWPTEKRNAYLKSDVASTTIDTLFRPTDFSAKMSRVPAITWLDKDRLYFREDGKIVFFRTGANRGSYKTWDETGADVIEIEAKSEHIASIKKDNLFVFDGKSEIQVTKDGGKGIVYGQSVHRNEFGIDGGLFWSPEGSKLAFYRMDERMVTSYPLVDLDSFPAQERSIPYPMAGQTSHQVSLGVFDVKTGKTIYLKTAGPDDHYLTNISWSPDEQFILIAELNRDQNKMQLNQYRSEDGSFVKTLITEENPQWVEPEHKALFVAGTKEQFMWQSERNGFNQLYLYNLNGKLLRAFPIGNELITEVYGQDPSGKAVYAAATSNHGLDRQILKLDMKGKITYLTSVSGTHQATWNSDFTYFIDRFSSIQVPGRLSLVDSKGKELRVLDEAVNPIAMEALVTPELVELKASDGTILNGRLFKPRNMEEGKQYPVVIYVYGGPHAQMVTNSWLGGGNLWMSWMASQGYAVFTLDNRGSDNRGLEFEQAIHRQLGVVEMEDQLAGVAYLKTLRWVNPARIGVHGWSFGGFMTTTMMTKNPGMFKAGVAGGPVIDWALYEVMYTERYMDTPQQNPEGFTQTSLLNSAKNLKDRLMLIHGTVDNVVVWQHSQLMVKSCVDNDVLIDYMIYPGHEHNVRGKDRLHLYKTISRYLMENLREEKEY